MKYGCMHSSTGHHQQRQVITSTDEGVQKREACTVLIKIYNFHIIWQMHWEIAKRNEINKPQKHVHNNIYCSINHNNKEIGILQVQF